MKRREFITTLGLGAIAQEKNSEIVLFKSFGSEPIWQFKPQPDIAVYELAQIVEKLMRGMQVQASEETMEKSYPGMTRHFTKIDN